MFGSTFTPSYKDPVVSTSYQRGTIYDKNGQILAISVPYCQVIANPRNIKNKESAASFMSFLLGLPYDSLLQTFNKNTAYAVLKRKIPIEQIPTLKEKVKEANLSNAITIEQYTARSYPSNFHGAQVIGFTDIDSNGLEGIELSLNSYLNASPVINQNISYGHDVYLTLDIQLQYLADSIMQNMCQIHDPDYAVLMVMDATNGEILASTSYPWYNLNSYNNSTEDQRQNKVFTFAYEPGSVFKVFSLATTLEANQADFSTPYVCTGSKTFKIGNQSLTINCHEPHGVLDAAGMIKASCNGAIATWALETDSEVFLNTLKSLHFGSNYPSLELYNASGLLSDISSWSFRSKPTISFGQEMSATPLQLTTAATIFANDGQLLMPQIISKIVDQKQNVIYQAQKQVQGQIISKEVADYVKDAMVKATEEGGTAIKVSVPGIKVAAKTGTAERLGSNDGSVTASTLALVPADDPKYIIYIAASNPKGDTIWGANIASPAIGELIEDMISCGYLKSQEYKQLTN